VGFVTIGTFIILCYGVMGNNGFFDNFADLIVAFQTQRRHIHLKLAIEIAGMRIVTGDTAFFIYYFVFYMYAVDILALICMASEAQVVSLLRQHVFFRPAVWIMTNGTYTERDRSVLEFVLWGPVMTLEAKIWLIDYRLEFVVHLICNPVTGIAGLLGRRSVHKLTENS